MPAEVRRLEKRSGSPVMGAHTPSPTDAAIKGISCLFTRALTHFDMDVPCGGLHE